MEGLRWAFLLGVILLCLATSTSGIKEIDDISKYPKNSNMTQMWKLVFARLTRKCKPIAHALSVDNTGNANTDCIKLFGEKAKEFLLHSNEYAKCTENEYSMMRDVVCEHNIPKSKRRMFRHLSTKCKLASKQLKHFYGKGSEACKEINTSEARMKALVSGCSEDEYQFMKRIVCKSDKSGSVISALSSWSLMGVCLLVQAVQSSHNI